MVAVATLNYQPIAPGSPGFVAAVPLAPGTINSIDLTTGIDRSAQQIIPDTLTIENGQSGGTLTVDFDTYALTVFPYTREVLPLYNGKNHVTISVDVAATATVNAYFSQGLLAQQRDNQFLIARQSGVFNYIEQSMATGANIIPVDATAAFYDFYVRGGGGGGGGCALGVLFGGGGGGGEGQRTEFGVTVAFLLSLGANLNCFVGAGGAAGSAAGGNGGNGATSFVQIGATVLVSCGGGTGGIGAAAAVGPNAGRGGIGGTGGAGGVKSSPGQGGGAGIGSINGARSAGIGGIGGGEGGGLAQAANSVAAAVIVAGVDGSHGGGGSGACIANGPAGAGALGGIGGDGDVIMRVYYTH